MGKIEFVTLEKSDLERTMKQAVKEGVKLYKEEENRKKLYTINEVRLLLGKSHKKVSQMVKEGILKATANNLIPQQELDRYLMAQ